MKTEVQIMAYADEKYDTFILMTVYPDHEDAVYFDSTLQLMKAAEKCMTGFQEQNVEYKFRVIIP